MDGSPRRIVNTNAIDVMAIGSKKCCSVAGNGLDPAGSAKRKADESDLHQPVSRVIEEASVGGKYQSIVTASSITAGHRLKPVLLATMGV